MCYKRLFPSNKKGTYGRWRIEYRVLKRFFDVRFLLVFPVDGHRAESRGWSDCFANDCMTRWLMSRITLTADVDYRIINTPNSIRHGPRVERGLCDFPLANTRHCRFVHFCAPPLRGIDPGVLSGHTSRTPREMVRKGKRERSLTFRTDNELLFPRDTIVHSLLPPTKLLFPLGKHIRCNC